MPRPTATQLWVYAALGVAIVALGLRSLLAPAAAPAPPGTTPGPSPQTATTGAVTVAQTAPSTAIVVHVVGAVAEPGLYRLRDGARVADALERAGGTTGKAALDGVNLAAKVADGQQVVVPRRGAAGAPAVTGPGGASVATGAPAGGPVSLSSATLEQLDTLPGVGPATAQKILDHRDASGGFRSVDDLASVPGIGPKRLAALRDAVAP